MIGTATYDPYGKVAASTGTVSPLGVAGEYTDAETGFVYLRARYYDRRRGQFLSRDPITALTQEPYAYAANPINYVDPFGLAPWDVIEDAWDATGGKAVTFVDDHRDAIATGLALVGGITCGVAAGATTGGLATPLCYSVTVAALGLSARDSYVDNDPIGFLVDVGFAVLPFAGGSDEMLFAILNAGSGSAEALLNFNEAIGMGSC